MLYTSTEDFFNHIDKLKKNRKLTREEEKELAQKMKNGDDEAKKALTEAYLPFLATLLKRYTSTPSLDMIYKGIQVLETSIATFDFFYDSLSPNVTFVNFLSNKIKQIMIRYIAEKTI